MLINFFQTLKKLEIPVSVKEFLVLLEAMQARLAFGSVDDFYLLARSCLVKDEKYFDRFDRAFGAWFKDLESLEDVLNALVPDKNSPSLVCTAKQHFYFRSPREKRTDLSSLK